MYPSHQHQRNQWLRRAFLRSSITGFPPAIIVNGSMYASDDPAPAGVAAEGRAFDHQQTQRGQHRRQKVSDAHEQERLVTRHGGITPGAHAGLSGVQEDAIDAPRHDGQQGEKQPGFPGRLSILSHKPADSSGRSALLQMVCRATFTRRHES